MECSSRPVPLIDNAVQEMVAPMSRVDQDDGNVADENEAIMAMMMLNGNVPQHGELIIQEREV